MICKHSLKLAKANRAVMVIVSPKVIAVPMRSQMGNVPMLDAKVSRHVMANVVPKVIVREKANAVTVIAAQRDVLTLVRMVALANGLLKAIVLPKVIAARMATVVPKGKAVEARCLGSLNCSTRTKMDGSAATNSIV